ncbi:MAG: ABC transporter ATP-binding protein [Bdellovibrionales bacterium]|nr:ABC transporter ATP-binding protein [Bdellovibrionales bacterium]
MEQVISVENISKKFSYTLRRGLFLAARDMARKAVSRKPKRNELRPGEFWAFKDISFELSAGGAIGIVGENGAGKSTLLRVLTGIYPPDTGQILSKGRIGALISVGAGFHPHLTGRENIYLNGTLIGMNRDDIRRMFDEIVDFADIGKFIDSPVSTYSSGMVVRLGFAISIHSNPDVLIADEVLAVGDLGFALKCHKRIADYQAKGGAIVLVSHSMQLVRNVCRNVLWLDQGKVKLEGESRDVCSSFETYMLNKAVSGIEKSGTRVISNDPTCTIAAVKIDGKALPEVDWDQTKPLDIIIKIRSQRRIIGPLINFSLFTVDGVIIVTSYSQIDGNLPDLIVGEKIVGITLGKIGLQPGKYFLTLVLSEGSYSNVIEWHERAYVVNVQGQRRYSDGILAEKVSWNSSPND